MRTTIDIDDDVLSAARDLAKVEGKTMGQVISELARKALTAPAGGGFAEAQAGFEVDDWVTFPRRGGPPVTSELIRQIQDEIDMEDMVPWDHERDAPRIFDDGPGTGPARTGPARTGAARTAKKKPRQS